jgi:predicted O-methyltransferase YrrM
MGVLVRDPRQLLEVAVDQAERAVEPLRARPSGHRRPLDEIVAELDRTLGAEVSGFLGEGELAEIDVAVRERTERLGPNRPFPIAHNAAPSLARLCYALCRALRPAAVVETGVAYGVTSAFLAKALEVNGRGELQSVDRAPVRPGVEDYIGALVPDELRSRWTLHRGRSRRLLPRVLEEVEGLSMFIHDSWHTYRNMSWELETATPHLVPPAVVLVDDAVDNRAFENWVERCRPQFSAVVAEDPVGVAVIQRA